MRMTEQIDGRLQFFLEHVGHLEMLTLEKKHFPTMVGKNLQYSFSRFTLGSIWRKKTLVSATILLGEP
jgi:hypothetical protein